MNLKEAVAVFALVRTSLETKQEELAKNKKKFEEDNALLVSDIKDLQEKLSTCFTEIEKDIKEEFEKDKTVKKFYGGFGVQEKKKITYDFETALRWAKEKDMFVTLDVTSFEKAVEGMKLDFVTIDKEPSVKNQKKLN
jgi:hypothetical protein